MKGAAMLLKQAYLERAIAEVEDLTARVALLKSRVAKQKLSVKLEFYAELDYVRNRFAEYKHCVERLEEANDVRLEDAEQAVEIVWKDLKDTIDLLIAALP
jgi:DNA repair exonuclease SbcCD ATPase subunit